MNANLEAAREAYFGLGGIESDIGPREDASWYWRRAFKMQRHATERVEAALAREREMPASGWRRERQQWRGGIERLLTAHERACENCGADGGADIEWHNTVDNTVGSNWVVCVACDGTGHQLNIARAALLDLLAERDTGHDEAGRGVREETLPAAVRCIRNHPYPYDPADFITATWTPEHAEEVAAGLNFLRTAHLDLAADPWVSVAERLPEPATWVLAFWSAGMRARSAMVAGNGEWHLEDGQRCISPTHWAPLPKAPGAPP